MSLRQLFTRSELRAALWALRREFMVGLLFTVVINLLMLTPTLYMLQVFDRVLLSQSELTLIALTLVMLFFFGVMAFSEWVRSRLLVRTGVKLDTALNSRVFKASFDAQLKQPGVNTTQAFLDLTNLRQALTGNSFFALMDMPWTPIYLGVLFMLHPFLGLLSVVFSVVLMGFAYYSSKATYQPLEAAAKSSTEEHNYLLGKLKNAGVVESMGMAGHLRRLWMGRHGQLLQLNHHAQDQTHRMQAISKFLRYTQQSLALGAGALLVIDGQLSPGAMIAANVLMGRATQPLDMVVSSWRTTVTAWDAFKRLEKLLEDFPARTPTATPPSPTGHISLQNLSATAPRRIEPILKDLSAQFAPGQVIGILGHSGSGKSTLARCLVGIWPHCQGQVLLDGHPLNDWDRDELGPHLGYLPQDIELFDGSIAQNVARFGSLNADLVIQACQRAGIHDMILRFPQGYDTPLGAAGGTLSGGQRQRIGLARALYGDPQIIVLDEPDANLDEAGEAALARALVDLKARGKTVFVISHRRNVLSATDHLLIIHNGRIQNWGPRDQVLAAVTAVAQRPAHTAAPQATPA